MFVALGGSAVALNGQNTVQSDDLGPGSQVKAPDVAANAVNGSDVVDNSITGADVNESNLGRVRYSVNSILGGKGVSSPGKGHCDPDGEFVNCASVTINLPGSSNVFLTGYATAWNESSGNANGNCRIGAAGHGAAPGSEVPVTTIGNGYTEHDHDDGVGAVPGGLPNLRARL